MLLAMIRIELKAEETPSKEEIKKFKEENPETKIRVMKDGKIFLYIPEEGD